MAASPCSSFLYYALGRLFLFTARLLVDGGRNADAFLFSRHDELSNRRNRRDTKTCDAGLEQDAKEGRSQRSHESCVPRLLLDSGASHHVVGDPSLLPSFTTFTPAGSAAAYQARDGRILPVVGAGTVSCDHHLHLDDVLYVPDLRAAVVLVSVPQLAERGYLVMLGAGQCSVRHQSSGEIVGKGQLHGDDSLYHLEFLRILPDTADATNTPAGATDSVIKMVVQ